MQNPKPPSNTVIVLRLIIFTLGWIVLMFFVDHFDPPASDQLTIFIGKVDSISLHGKNHRVQITASNQSDKISVTISPIWDRHVRENLQLGQTVEIGYFRQNFMSTIDVWNIRSGQRSIISYQEFVVEHQQRSSLHNDLVALYEKFR